MIATDAPVENHQPRWLIWRVAVPLLTLLFVVYPAVMPPLPHERAAVVTPVTEPVPMQARETESCPPLDLCKVATVEQALPRLPVPPTLLFSLAVIVFAVRWQPRPRMERRGWWWPPDRRRALLQVFLM